MRYFKWEISMSYFKWDQVDWNRTLCSDFMLQKPSIFRNVKCYKEPRLKVDKVQ